MRAHLTTTSQQHRPSPRALCALLQGTEDADDIGDDDVDLAPAAKKFKNFKGEVPVSSVVRLGQPCDPNTGIMPAYIIDLHDAGIKNVIDFTFLEGYFEPSVVFLHENKRTWVGRVAVMKNTCQLTALSLNLVQKRHPMIWSASGMPFNCRYIVPVPAPAGGALVISSTMLIYRNHGHRCALKLNDYAIPGGDGNLKYDSLSDPVIFDTVHPARLDGYQMLFGLMAGGLFILSFHLDEDGHTVKALEVHPTSASTSTSVGTVTCLTKLGDNHVFLGSRLGDSALLKITRLPWDDRTEAVCADAVPKAQPAAGPGAAVQESSESGVVKAEADPMDEDDPYRTAAPVAAFKHHDTGNGVNADADLGDSDDELYGKPETEAVMKVEAEVVEGDSDDELYGGGESSHAAAGDGMDVEREADRDIGVGAGVEQIDEFDDEEAAMYATARTDNLGGRDRRAVALKHFSFAEDDKLVSIGPISSISLSSHRPSIDEVKRDAQELVATSGGKGSGKVSIMQRSLRPNVTTAVELPTAQAVWTVYGPAEEGNEESKSHAYMIISLGGDEPATVVLKGKELEEFDEDEQMDFHTVGSTICVANIFHHKRIVQVGLCCMSRAFVLGMSAVSVSSVRM
jgi:hypothetical protein